MELEERKGTELKYDKNLQFPRNKWGVTEQAKFTAEPWEKQRKWMATKRKQEMIQTIESK